MMPAFFLFANILAVPSLSSAQDTNRPAKEEPTSVKVEVRAKLRVTGKLRKLPYLETPAKPGSPASYSVDEASLATGAAVETKQLGVIEVYFGGDQQLQELAVKLNRKTVVISGDLDSVTYLSGEHLVPVEMMLWNAFNKTTVMMPSWVTKTFIRAKRIAPVTGP